MSILVRNYFNCQDFTSEDSIVNSAINGYCSQSSENLFPSRDAVIETLKNLVATGKLLRLIESKATPFYGYELTAIVKNNIAFCRKLYSSKGRKIGGPPAIKASVASRSTITTTKEHKYLEEKNRQYEAKRKREIERANGKWVYYVQWENDSTYVKIGYSSSPKGRLTGFLTSSPNRLILLGLEPVSCAQEEADRHKKFDAYWHKREWFCYEGLLKEHVQSLDLGHAIEFWEQLPSVSKSEIKVERFR